MRKLIRKMISEAITAGPLGSVYIPDEDPYETLSDALKAKVSKEDFLKDPDHYLFLDATLKGEKEKDTEEFVKGIENFEAGGQETYEKGVLGMFTDLVDSVTMMNNELVKKNFSAGYIQFTNGNFVDLQGRNQNILKYIEDWCDKIQKSNTGYVQFMHKKSKTMYGTGFVTSVYIGDRFDILGYGRGGQKSAPNAQDFSKIIEDFLKSNPYPFNIRKKYPNSSIFEKIGFSIEGYPGYVKFRKFKGGNDLRDKSINQFFDWNEHPNIVRSILSKYSLLESSDIYQLEIFIDKYKWGLV